MYSAEWEHFPPRGLNVNVSEDLSRRSRATLPEGESFLSQHLRATLPEGESFLSRHLRATLPEGESLFAEKILLL